MITVKEEKLIVFMVKTLIFIKETSVMLYGLAIFSLPLLLGLYLVKQTFS